MAPTRSRRLSGAAERRPVALVVIGVLLFSTGPVLVQTTSVTGPILSFWRLWIGVVALGIASVVHVRVTGRRPTLQGWGWAARAGVAFGVHQLMFMIAIKATSVVDVTLMQVLAPMIVAVLAVPLFGERPGRTFRLWSVVAVAGAAVVALGGSSGPEGDPIGMLLAVGNVVLFAFYFVWSKQGRDVIDVVPFLFGVAVVAGLTVSAYVVVAGEAPRSARAGDIAVAGAIALGPGALGHFVSTWPLRWVPANIPPLLQLAIPFLAGTLAWLLLDESITLTHLVGGAVTIAGVGGALWSPAGRRMTAREDATITAGSA